MSKAVTEFESQCGKAKMYIDNTMPIGVFHDFLMEIKGLMVERMVKAHKEQEQEIEGQSREEAQDAEPNCCEAPSCLKYDDQLEGA